MYVCACVIIYGLCFHLDYQNKKCAQCERACADRIIYLLCTCGYCVCMCVHVHSGQRASCPLLPSGRMCNGDKLFLLASTSFTADVFQVCVFVCVLVYVQGH